MFKDLKEISNMKIDYQRILRSIEQVFRIKVMKITENTSLVTCS